METITFEYAASAPAKARVMTGVVASGDLEVLLEPGTDGHTCVTITTSVEGLRATWDAVLRRILVPRLLPAAQIEINDFGASPGVVRMRIEQAFEELQVKQS